MPETAPTTRWSTLIFFLVWLASSGYLGINLNRGWVPHDEGALGQSAERVLHGEMPHRDFDDPYTGGLSYLGASAFWLLGVKLLALRYMLFAFFLAWVPALYAVAREFSDPWPAAGITILAVVWSVPIYPAAMPSWFCLFWATFGTLALLKFVRSAREYWLVLAGLCGGFSFLIKSSGLFFVAGTLLFLVYEEQSRSRENRFEPRRTPIYSASVALCLVVFCSGLTKLVMPSGGISDFLHFVLPEISISLLLVTRELQPAEIGEVPRFKSLLKMVFPTLIGFALPLLMLLAWYWFNGSTHELLNGIFVLHRRLIYTRLSPPNPILFLPSIILALMLTEREPRGGFRPFIPSLKVLFAALFLVSCFFLRRTYIVAFEAAWGAIPVLAVGAVALLWRLPSQNIPRPRGDHQTVLLLSVTVLCSLIQFPFSVPIYFCYVAPLTVLTAAAVLSNRYHVLPENSYSATLFFALFAVFVLRPGFLSYMGYSYHSDEQTVHLAVPRAESLRIAQSDAALYGELIPFVQLHAIGQPILAGPDCPEVYFLSGLRNPTRALFDSFQDPAEYQNDLERVVDGPNSVKVAVINNQPTFSADRLSVIQLLVIARFPESKTIGKFTVYWRP